MGEIHNVFVSHRHEDDDLITKFKELLKGKDVEIRDSSITSDNPNQAKNPDYIKQNILVPGIKWAGKLIVLITPDTKNHDWVEWEIEYANKRNKPIIGVWAHGSAGCELPEALEKYADALVSWNAKQILQALNGARNWKNSDGTSRPPQPIKRLAC